MSLTVGASTGVVGLLAVVVVGWGAWLSVGSSRRGPQWAYDSLTRWRLMPWVLTVAGAAMAVLVEPVWVGVSVAYVGLVTGFLMRSVRRRLDHVREMYGGFDAPTVAPVAVTSRVGSYLLAGAVVLALLGAWDVSVRGWSGVFGVVLAAFLGGVALVLRRTG